MVFGIGTDIVEVARIKKILLKEQGFREKVFTANEIAYCDSRKNPYESYAARFAAKEAFFKALGTGWSGDMQFDEIEVVNESSGMPVVKLHGRVKLFTKDKGIDKIFISLSHTSGLANAMLVLEKS